MANLIDNWNVGRVVEEQEKEKTRWERVVSFGVWGFPLTHNI